MFASINNTKVICCWVCLQLSLNLRIQKMYEFTCENKGGLRNMKTIISGKPILPLSYVPLWNFTLAALVSSDWMETHWRIFLWWGWTFCVSQWIDEATLLFAYVRIFRFNWCIGLIEVFATCIEWPKIRDPQSKKDKTKERPFFNLINSWKVMWY